MFAGHELSKPTPENLRSLNHELINYLQETYPFFQTFDPGQELTKANSIVAPYMKRNIRSPFTKWKTILLGAEIYKEAYKLACAGGPVVDSANFRHEDYINHVISMLILADYLIQEGRPQDPTDSVEYSLLAPDLIDKIEILQTAEYTLYHNMANEFKPYKVFRLKRAGRLVEFGSNIIKMRESLNIPGFSRFHDLLEIRRTRNLYSPE